MKPLVQATVGAVITWISHLIWHVRTPLDALLRWVAVTFTTALVLNGLGY